MTENEIREFDESITDVIRTIPGFLWSFYNELENQGFSAKQSIELTKEYLRTLCGK